MKTGLVVSDRDEEIFNARLRGERIGAIAKRFKVTEREVRDVIARLVTPVSNQLRQHTVEIECERLDALETIYFPKAMKGDAGATSLCLRISELRADFLGTRSPVRIDPVQLNVTLHRKPDTTTKVLEALKRLGKQVPEQPPVIDGEVLEPGGINGHGKPEPDPAT